MVFTGKTIKAMTPKTETFGHLWMVKSTRLLHAEALHYRARPAVTDRRKGDYFFQPEQMEADAKGLFRCLGSEPFSPMRKRKTPADLDARRKRKLRRRRMQADKSDELEGGLALNGPEAPPLLFNERLATISHGVALFARERRGKKLHDPRICIHCSKGLAISAPPLA